MVDVLAELGGVATRGALPAQPRVLRSTGPSETARSSSSAEGRYSLPSVDDAPRLAHALGGVLSLTSAALHHGWEVKHTPERPHVTVPQRRRVDPSLSARVVMHYSDLMRDEITDGRRYNLMVVHGWLAPLACPATRRTFAAPVRGP